MRNKGTYKGRKTKHKLSILLKRFFNISLMIAMLTAAITPAIFAEDKVAAGTRDIANGVAAVPKTMAETANGSNIISGLIIGTVQGVLTAVEGVCEGTYKILTFHRDD